MLWDSHEGWVVLDVVQLPEEDFSLVGKMFPLRAGRSHFSLSNFQMQDTGDEMSAYVRLSVCFSMCISLLDQCTRSAVAPASPTAGANEMRFPQDGRINHGSFASLVYRWRDFPSHIIVYSVPNIFEYTSVQSAKGVRKNAVHYLRNWKKASQTLCSMTPSFLAVQQASSYSERLWMINDVRYICICVVKFNLFYV